MRKFKVLVTALCMCTMLSAPLTSFAAMPQVTLNGYSIVNPNAAINRMGDKGLIQGNNVNLRWDNDLNISLGQVNDGDIYILLSDAPKYWNGYRMNKVYMFSGSNQGQTGWIATIYLSKSK